MLLGTARRLTRRARWWFLALGAAALALMLPAARKTATHFAVRDLIEGLTAKVSLSVSTSKLDDLRHAVGKWLEDKKI